MRSVASSRRSRPRLSVCKAREQAACNRLEAHLSRHWPEILCLLPLGSATLAVLIGAYGDPASVAAEPSAAEELMRRTGRPGLSEEKIQAVLDSAQNSLGVVPVGPERALLQWLANDSLAAHQEVAQVEREIEQRLAHDTLLAILAMVIGKVSAAVLLASAGSPLDYPNAASYLKARPPDLVSGSGLSVKGAPRVITTDCGGRGLR